MFIVDESYDLESVATLAAHAEGIDPRVRNVLEEHWTDTKSVEFMKGLLTGYANAHALFSQEFELAQLERGRPVSTLAAFVAEKLIQQLDREASPAGQ